MPLDEPLADRQRGGCVRERMLTFPKITSESDSLGKEESFLGYQAQRTPPTRPIEFHAVSSLPPA